MTKKEFLENVKNGIINDEVIAKATALYETESKSSETEQKNKEEKRAVNLARAKRIMEHLNADEYTSATELYDTYYKDKDEDITNLSRITTALKVAEEDKLVITIDNYKKGGKGKAVKGYKLAATETTETTDEQ